jgi:hypothetical protein
MRTTKFGGREIGLLEKPNLCSVWLRSPPMEAHSLQTWDDKRRSPRSKRLENGDSEQQEWRDWRKTLS